jgi:hypothetical protein
MDRPILLPPQVGRLLRARHVDRSSEHGWDGYVGGYDVPAVVPAEAVAQAGRCLAAYRAMCAPMDERDLAVELYRLRQKTIRRNEQELDWQVALDVWLDELAVYPADIVLWALRFWGRNERFFPIGNDLQRLIEPKVTERRVLMEALEKLATPAEVLRPEGVESMSSSHPNGG